MRSVERVWGPAPRRARGRSEEHTSELQSQSNLVCRLLLEKKKIILNLRISGFNSTTGWRRTICKLVHFFVFYWQGLNILYRIFIFFFNDTATTEIYTLSLHDALPISPWCRLQIDELAELGARPRDWPADRKSTRLNSSHSQISYAVFCLKKKKNL